MASSLVFIFLLDNLPGNILNKTLEELIPLGHHITNVEQCNSGFITDAILEAVDKKLNVKTIPRWTSDHDRFLNLYYLNKSRDILKESSAETLFNIQTVLDNSLEDSNSFQNLVENRYAKYFSNEDKSECENKKITFPGKENVDEMEIKYPMKASVFDVSDSIPVSVSEVAPEVVLPERVPNLVAIFETLSNVTAQTCGGTVVSPHWVLTAASCVNVLGNLYNTTNQTEKSHYTIIANATNPLIDGTVHNVTRVVVHPDHVVTGSILGLIKHLHNTLLESKKDLVEKRKEKTPTLALMRIEPEVAVETLEVMGGVLAGDVRVYGWVLMKNESGNSMYATSFPATTLTPFDCEIKYGITDAKSLLCLSTSNDTAKDVSQLSSGGPVLSIHHNRVTLAAVAQTDDRSPLVAHPLGSHAAWVARLVHNK